MRKDAPRPTGLREFLAAALLVSAAVLLAAGPVAAEGASDGEKERLADFLNKFAEQHIHHLVADEMTTDDMTSFAIQYNWFNSRYYTGDDEAPDSVKEVENPDGSTELTLDGALVGEAVKRFFGREIQPKSVGEYRFDGTSYRLGPPGALGDVGTPPVVTVTEAARGEGGLLAVQGYWETVDDEPRKLPVQAVVRAYGADGGEAWALVSLDIKEDAE